MGIFEATLKKIELILSWVTGNGFEFKSHYWGAGLNGIKVLRSNPEQGLYLTSRGGYLYFSDNFLSIFQRKSDSNFDDKPIDGGNSQRKPFEKSPKQKQQWFQSFQAMFEIDRLNESFGRLGLFEYVFGFAGRTIP